MVFHMRMMPFMELNRWWCIWIERTFVSNQIVKTFLSWFFRCRHSFCLCMNNFSQLRSKREREIAFMYILLSHLVIWDSLCDVTIVVYSVVSVFIYGMQSPQLQSHKNDISVIVFVCAHGVQCAECGFDGCRYRHHMALQCKVQLRWCLFVYLKRNEMERNEKKKFQRTSFLIYLRYLLWTSQHTRPFFFSVSLRRSLHSVACCRLFCHYFVYC